MNESLSMNFSAPSPRMKRGMAGRGGPGRCGTLSCILGALIDIPAREYHICLFSYNKLFYIIIDIFPLVF